MWANPFVLQVLSFLLTTTFAMYLFLYCNCCIEIFWWDKYSSVLSCFAGSYESLWAFLRVLWWDVEQVKLSSNMFPITMTAETELASETLLQHRHLTKPNTGSHSSSLAHLDATISDTLPLLMINNNCFGHVRVF